MRRALLLLVLAPALARADVAAPTAPITDVPTTTEPPTDVPPEIPTDPPTRPVVEPPPPSPGFTPDPIATHPAGLDPLTLCHFATSCAPDPEIVAAITGDPLRVAATASGALLAYANHPSRTGGSELATRLELWRGLSWSAQLGYTLDAIDTTTATTLYHDLSIGGRVALPVGRPAWLVGTAHVLSGTQAGGNGGAGFAAAGARFAGLDLQLGLAGVSLDGNGGVTASLRAGIASDEVEGWLELDVQSTTVAGMTIPHVNGAGGLLVRRGHLAVDLEALVGDRAYSVIDNGASVESVGDTFHTTGRALLRYDLTPHLHPYIGGSARSATTITNTTSTDYNIFTGFAGLSLAF